jgi:protein-L-isoaspartate(D-aspartate) O-methyltransferase
LADQLDGKQIIDDQIAVARRAYAEELRFTARLRSLPVIDALAKVPRERFVGPGPWRIKSPMHSEYWTTDNADPRSVYHDVLIALDESRGINNGQPLLWAFLFEQLAIVPGEHVLHLGCGSGYYTAIAAELAGPAGNVMAVELDTALADRARSALAPWRQVMVLNGDGATSSFDPFDVIFASAGASHPLPSWIDALKTGGRLLFPLTTAERQGGIVLVRRQNAETYSARVLCPCGFIEFTGARELEIAQRLAAAFARDRGSPIRTLRRAPHAEDESCWLHGNGWCFSKTESGGGEALGAPP